MKKSLICFSLITTLLFTNIAYAGTTTPKSYLATSVTTLPKSVIISENGTKLIPVESVVTSIGYTTTYDDVNQTLNIKNKDQQLCTLTIGDNNYITPNCSIQLEEAPQIINQKVYVPATFISEVLFYEYEITTTGDLLIYEYTPMTPYPIEINEYYAPFSLVASSQLNPTIEINDDVCTLTLSPLTFNPDDKFDSVTISSFPMSELTAKQQAEISKNEVILAESVDGNIGHFATNEQYSTGAGNYTNSYEGTITSQPITTDINGYTFEGYTIKEVVDTNKENLGKYDENGNYIVDEYDANTGFILKTNTILFMNDLNSNMTYSINIVSYGDAVDKNIIDALSTFTIK